MIKKLACLLLVGLLLFPALAVASEEAAGPILWNGGAEALNFVDPPRLPNSEAIEVSTMIDQRVTYAEYGHNVFLHGVALAFYHEAMVITFAVNPNGENMYGERCWAWWSYDGGVTWENGHCFEAHTANRETSHGSLVVANDELYALVSAPDFQGHTVCEFWRYDEDGNDWEFVYGLNNLFPSSPVVQTADGNWAVGGSGVFGAPSVAVTRNGDFFDWKLSRLSGASQGFGEVGLMVQGDTVTALIRPEILAADDPWGVAATRGTIMVATSENNGKNFGKAAQSEIYSSKAEICGGVLSDGRPYAIFNMSIEYPANYKPSRMRFLLAVGEPGSACFNKLYTLLEAKNPVCYPYAVEKDGILYVGYSEMLPLADHQIDPDHMSNSNNAMLMKIPLSCI